MRIEALAAQQLLAALREQDEVPDEDVELIVASETNLTEAVESALLASMQDEAHVAAIGALCAKLTERAERKRARIERRRFAILAAMELAGVRKLELASTTVSLGKGRRKVIVTDETALPPDLVRETVKRSPDMRAIADRLEAGEPVTGACLSNAMPTLTVRTR